MAVKKEDQAPEAPATPTHVVTSRIEVTPPTTEAALAMAGSLGWKAFATGKRTVATDPDGSVWYLGGAEGGREWRRMRPVELIVNPLK